MTSPDQVDAPRFERRVTAGTISRVDVIVPYFNHGPFIEDCVASARSQSHSVDRIIVVDDGSTDGYSLEVLQALEAVGSIEVIRQPNQGPSAARNRGVAASTADAVVFLDGDDLLTPNHVEVGLAALASANDSVGFAYPDQQCFGTLDDLAVMPPYNLYLLANRNYCGTSMVDMAVFAAGHQFREDLRHGHEDWEFFLRLGLLGIYGTDFHGAPVCWRRWGYSRSDGINHRSGVYAGELRELHPELFEPRRMIELKRVWSPALSVVLAGHEGRELTSAMARQTCDDYEFVESRPYPHVRGRWVLLLDISSPANDAAKGLLEQPDLVERILRSALEMPRGSALRLIGGRPEGASARWQELSGAESGLTVGVVVEGRRYEEWLSSPPDADGENGQRIQSQMTALIGVPEAGQQYRWVGDGRRPVRPSPRADQNRTAALPPPQGVTGHEATATDAGADRAERSELTKQLEESFEQERAARWAAVPLFFTAEGVRRSPEPPGGYEDAAEALSSRAWDTWAPSFTARLDLVVDHVGHGLLEITYDVEPSDHRTSPAGLRVSLGRLWTRKFPGTMALYARTDVYTHRVTYRLSDGPPESDHEARLGYVATEPLSDMVSLAHQIELAVAGLESVFESLTPPIIDIPDLGVFLEPARGGNVLPLQAVVRGRLAPWLYGAGGLGTSLYELTLHGGRTRYATHPDAPIAHPDVARPIALVIGELGPVRPDRPAPVLQEVQNADGTGTAYVTGPVSPDEPGQAAGPPIGTFATDPGTSAPLVRLHPEPPLAPPPAEPGHRLAIDWKPLVRAGYVVEGVVGYVWQPEPNQAPLYCWDTEDGRERLLTLGEPPQGDRSRWHFQGTFGLAWQPHAARHGLVNLWELRLDDRVTYAIDPSEFEAMGYACVRVIARVPLRRRPGSIPLWRTGPTDELRWRFTTCPDEGADDGFVRQGMICFLDPAHPQPADDAAVNGLGDIDLAKEIARGPVPFGTPIYRLTGGQGRALRPSGYLPVALDAIVEEVAGYLPPEDYGVRQLPIGAARPLEAETTSPPAVGPVGDAAPLPTRRLVEPLLRRAVTYLPDDARRALSAGWRRWNPGGRPSS
jgi:Glycosyl transferase family 2